MGEEEGEKKRSDLEKLSVILCECIQEEMDETQGKLFGSTIEDEATWTLEDKKLIRISLMKTSREAGNCWTSLLEGEYCADPLVQEQMQKQLTLERFQRENPGFDFSGADISGNYAGGGPDFSNLGK
ncbi:UNVERIFIED_CONTAM: hypothetical protein FKN15_043039 [Acipenser sinensis]